MLKIFQLIKLKKNKKNMIKILLIKIFFYNKQNKIYKMLVNYQFKVENKDNKAFWLITNLTKIIKFK